METYLNCRIYNFVVEIEHYQRIEQKHLGGLGSSIMSTIMVLLCGNIIQYMAITNKEELFARESKLRDPIPRPPIILQSLASIHLPPTPQNHFNTNATRRFYRRRITARLLSRREEERHLCADEQNQST